MDKLGAMQAFTKVVSLGSFAGAGRALGLTRSAVSKAVMELEQLLGARLLDRTTRRVGPTEVGRAYYERCVDVLATIEETELQVSRRHDEPKGVLKINGPGSFGVLYLGSAIAEFMVAYPDVTVHLTLTDRFIDPIEEGADVTIRIARLADSSLIARKLALSRRVLVAAPDYLARHGEPRTPNDLGRHRCLTYGHATAMQRWQLTEGHQTMSVPIISPLCSNSGDILRAAALQGQGIAMLPTFLVGPDLKRGALRLVMPDYPPIDGAIFALYAPNKYLAAKTRVLIDFLVARFAKPTWDEWEHEKLPTSA